MKTKSTMEVPFGPNACVKPDRCAERRSGTRHHAAEPRSGLGLNELLGGACSEYETTNCKHDQPRKMLATGVDQRQETRSDSGVANDLHGPLRGQLSLARREHKCTDSKPGNSGDVPSEPQRLPCEVRAAEGLGKIVSAEEASEDVPLTENGVSKSKSDDKNGSELQHRLVAA